MRLLLVFVVMVASCLATPPAHAWIVWGQAGGQWVQSHLPPPTDQPGLAPQLERPDLVLPLEGELDGDALRELPAEDEEIDD